MYRLDVFFLLALCAKAEREIAACSDLRLADIAVLSGLGMFLGDTEPSRRLARFVSGLAQGEMSRRLGVVH